MEPRLAKVNGNVRVALADVLPDEEIESVCEALAVSLELDLDEMKFFVVGVSGNQSGEVRKYLWRGDEALLNET